LLGLAVVGSYLFVLWALWPRHHALAKDLTVSQRLWFFGDINAMKRFEYTEALERWTEQDLEETLTAQNHILSQSVWIKHEALHKAIVLTIVGLILLVPLGVAYAIAVTHMPPPRSDSLIP
jgi:hypothetical protein